MRVLAAEVVEIAMLRLHELDVDFHVLVPARAAGVHEELDVDAFLVHVLYACVHVPVVALGARKFGSHEAAGDTALLAGRLRFAEHARHIRTPAADGTAAQAERAELSRIGHVGPEARRGPVAVYL